MSNLEAFMIIHPWHLPAALLIIGFLAGLLCRPLMDRAQNHEARLEVRTRDVDEHTLVTGEDA